MRLTHKQEYKDKRKNREPMLKIRNKLFDYENIEEKHSIILLNDLDNRLTALEIIKEKRVNIEYLKCCEYYEQYKTICSYWNEITEKEFYLLKEVLS